MTTTQLRIDAACQVVRLRAKADRAAKDGLHTSAFYLTSAADREERRYKQLRAKESAEILSAARGLGWEVVG